MTNNVEFPPLGRRPVVVWSGPLEKGALRFVDNGLALAMFCFDGMMRVEVAEDRWFIPDRFGIWIPAGMAPLVAASDRIEFQVFQVNSRFCDRIAMPDHPAVLRATPLMRGIARRMVQGDPLPNAQERRLGWVALDEISRLKRPDLHLPGSKDVRLAQIISHILAEPREAGSLARLARRAGISERTLSRLFQNETGMTWRNWRDRMRFVLALEGIQRGHGSTKLAASLGYSSPSAFVAAFRRQSGMTPTEWRHHR